MCDYKYKNQLNGLGFNGRITAIDYAPAACEQQRRPLCCQLSHLTGFMCLLAPLSPLHKHAVTPCPLRIVQKAARTVNCELRTDQDRAEGWSAP